jgi:hypothetical protein
MLILWNISTVFEVTKILIFTKSQVQTLLSFDFIFLEYVIFYRKTQQNSSENPVLF